MFCAVLLGAPFTRRRKRALAVLMIALAVVGGGFLMSCGGGGSSIGEGSSDLLRDGDANGNRPSVANPTPIVITVTVQ